LTIESTLNSERIPSALVNLQLPVNIQLSKIRIASSAICKGQARLPPAHR